MELLKKYITAFPRGSLSILFLAVMTLRQFKREAARKQDEVQEHFGHEHTKREVQEKKLKDMAKDKKLLLVRLVKAAHSSELFLPSFLLMASYDINLFQATVAEVGLTSEYKKTHTAALKNSAVPQEKPSERSGYIGAKVQLPAHGGWCLNSSYVRCLFYVLTFTQAWLI